MRTLKQHITKRHQFHNGTDPIIHLPLIKFNLHHMKNHILKLAVLLILMSSGGSLWAQYGIGTNTPNASAALDIVSPDKGILIPSISLTSSSTFAPITGTSSTTHNGMIVWNKNDITTNGLTGSGFYFWQNDPTTSGMGYWYKLNSTDDGSIPESGTVTNSTLRWDGTNWVETTTLLQTDSATGTATLAANATVTGTLEVTGTTTLTSDLFVGGNTTASGTLTAQSTTTLEAALVDGTGKAGTDGQVLSSTGTSTRWVDPNAAELATLTTTGSVSSTVSILLIVPSGSNITATLPNASTLSVGYELKIRRNADYTGTNDLITISGFGGQTIDGQSTKNMNVGYQSMTLLNIGGSWVTID